MKATVLAIIGVVLIVAVAGVVLSDTSRNTCLQQCRDQGDACAEPAYRAHAFCPDGPVVCDQSQQAALQQCAAVYDVCRYTCDSAGY
jgi:hypothetical protein